MIIFTHLEVSESWSCGRDLDGLNYAGRNCLNSALMFTPWRSYPRFRFLAFSGQRRTAQLAGSNVKGWYEAPGPLLSLPRFSVPPNDAVDVRQEHGQQSQQRHERTCAIYKTDAGVIRKFAQERRCNPRGAESEAEEQP